MSTQPEQSNDAALKSALKRVCGGQVAPASLRQRVQMTLAQAHQSAAPIPLNAEPIRLAWWQTPVFRLAAAVLAVALAGMIYQTMHAGGRGQGVIRRDALLALVADHDRCCGESYLGTADNIQSAAQVIHRQLNWPVLAPDLASEGWQFRGAVICRVNGREGAHLLFARGKQRLSVYSVPAIECTDGIEGLCCDQIGGHVMASIIRDGELYCIVGHCPSGGLKQQEIRGILERHLSNSLVVARMPKGGG